MNVAFLGSITEQLGISWPGILAQALIFVILYLILSKFAFGPVTAMLEQRRQRIAEGEENIKKIKSDLENANKKAAEVMAKANEAADRVVKEAQEAARIEREKAAQAAIAEAEQIKAKAAEAAKLDKERMVVELKREFGRLVVDATSKVTGKVLTGDDHNRIIEEARSQVSLN